MALRGPGPSARPEEGIIRSGIHRPPLGLRLALAAGLVILLAAPGSGAERPFAEGPLRSVTGSLAPGALELGSFRLETAPGEDPWRAPEEVLLRFRDGEGATRSTLRASRLAPNFPWRTREDLAFICATTIGFSDPDFAALCEEEDFDLDRPGTLVLLGPEDRFLLGCGPFHGVECTEAAGAAGLVGPELVLGPWSPLDPDAPGFEPPGCPPGYRDGELGTLPGCEPPPEDEDPDFWSESAELSWDALRALAAVSLRSEPVFDELPPCSLAEPEGCELRSDLGVLIWNALVDLVARSSDGEPPVGPDELDPDDPYRVDGCSFTRPERCRAVQRLLALTAREPGAGEGAPRRWLWETGAVYAVTEATGPLAPLEAEGWRLHVFGPGSAALPPERTGLLLLASPQDPLVAGTGAGASAAPFMARGTGSDGLAGSEDDPYLGMAMALPAPVAALQGGAALLALAGLARRRG